jgi:hypothetical protein
MNERVDLPHRGDGSADRGSVSEIDLPPLDSGKVRKRSLPRRVKRADHAAASVDEAAGDDLPEGAFGTGHEDDPGSTAGHAADDITPWEHWKKNSVASPNTRLTHHIIRG